MNNNTGQRLVKEYVSKYESPERENSHSGNAQADDVLVLALKV